jgi:hypothetical protein
MNKQFLVFLAIGLAVVAAVVSFTWVGTKGAHLALDGKILKVRSIGTDEKTTIVVLDFRLNNPTKTPFVVREGTITVIGADGKEVVGDTIARTDMNRVFDYYKLLGPKYNELLIIKDRVNGGQWIDRTIAATVALPASEFDQRKNLTLTLDDVDGPQFKFSER